jgi:hypothetical protein
VERNCQRGNQKHDRKEEKYIFTLYMGNGHHFYTYKKQNIIW